MKCLNRNTLEYQVLERVSGVPKFDLDASILYHLNKFQRYPYLDEIPGANSEINLKEILEIKEEKGIRTLVLKNVYNFTGASTVEEAIPILNNKFKDLEVDITPIDQNSATITIKHRPSEYGLVERNIKKTNNKLNTKSVIVKSLNKLSRLYGITFKEITQEELNSQEWKNKVPEAHSANAFIYNGTIYINTSAIENKSINQHEPKIHELLHIFLGGIRFSNPNLYFKLVSTMEQLPNISSISEIYKNRTQSDILEEIFVTEYAKYLTEQDNAIKGNISQNMLDEINYHIKRNLDSILMGKYSVKTLPNKEIMYDTIQSLSDKVESDVCNSSFQDFINIAAVHRRIANTKEGLIKEGKLQENCI